VSASINEQLLDDRLAQLEKARNWSPRLISKLESHIRSADDEALYRINPFSFAKEKNVPANEVIDLFLHATALGLFRKDWALFCPQCCCVVESLRSLRGVHNHYHCSFCQVGYETALDEYVASPSRSSPMCVPSPSTSPAQLTAWDNFIKVGNTRDGVLPDGTLFRDAKAQLGKAIEYLPPGETTRIEVDVAEGLVMAASTEGKLGMLLTVAGRARRRAPAQARALRRPDEQLQHRRGGARQDRVRDRERHVTAGHLRDRGRAARRRPRQHSP
jgi:hypothetical protein